MEAEYQNSVLPDCHDVDDRHPQNRIELGEQFLAPGNVPEEAVYRSALDRPCIQHLVDLIEPRLCLFVPLHIAVVPRGEVVPVTVLPVGDALLCKNGDLIHFGEEFVLFGLQFRTLHEPILCGFAGSNHRSLALNQAVVDLEETRLDLLLGDVRRFALRLAFVEFCRTLPHDRFVLIG